MRHRPRPLHDLVHVSTSCTASCVRRSRSVRTLFPRPVSEERSSGRARDRGKSSSDWTACQTRPRFHSYSFLSQVGPYLLPLSMAALHNTRTTRHPPRRQYFICTPAASALRRDSYLVLPMAPRRSLAPRTLAALPCRRATTYRRPSRPSSCRTPPWPPRPSCGRRGLTTA